MKFGQQLVVAALCAVAVGGVSAAEPASLQLGAQVRGEITTADPLNRSDGTRSRLYRVEIGEGQLVSFEVAGSLRAQLSLFDDETLVTRSGGDGQRASLSVRASRSAPYTLAVSGTDADAFGPYTLRAAAVEAYDGRVLRAGDSVSDWLDGKRTIPLQVGRQALYTIDMRSDEFDALLAIEGNGISASDDDGGEGTDARLTVVLPPGRYAITADGYGGDVRGLYRLAVAEQALPAGLNQGGRIQPDRGELQGVFSGTPLEYRFSLPARRLVTIDMRSEHFDSFLLLTGNGVEASDDDGGEGLNSRLVQVLDAGDYTIGAAAASSGSGLFALSLTTADVPEGIGGGTLAPGQEREGLLMAGAGDRFSVSVAEQGEYVVAMRSQDIDSYLRLVDADGEEIASDDDSGGGLDARIRTRLAPGDYVIEASSIDGSGGAYRISIETR